ncbi:MAG: tyrosine--tRNA ligase [Candidatus Velthaea sp.]
MALKHSAVDHAVAVLVDGCAHVETPRELADRLRPGRALRVKFGIDPTGSELHLGHAVTLHKMQQFVELGHDVTLLIGDFTALIGDPTGRKDSRPALTSEQIAHNMRTYTEQAARVLDLERISVRYNSEWLAPLTHADLIRLLQYTTVAQMLAREDFRERFTAERPITLQEFMYPVAVAYDSVALACDVELGGDDQLFNFLLGRTYQTHAGQPAQICMTLPILEGTDGVQRMGKSLGNYIAICEPPRDQFGKVMRIPDTLIARWARLADFRPGAECDALARGIADGSRSAMEEKKNLAERIVTRYHGADAARDAREFFERTIQRKELPNEMPELAVGKDEKVAEVLIAAHFAESKRAAQRLIGEGAVRIDGVPVTDPAARWPSTAPAVLQVGSRKFARIVPSER